MSLRFSLLNVQGLVSRRTNKLKSSELLNIFESSDLVLLTETWTDDFSDISVNHFEHFALNRKHIKAGSRRNSGGVILYIRNKFVSKDTLVFTSEDDFLWVKIDKSVLSSERDLYVCLCYVIPDGSSRQSMVESNIFDRLGDSVVHIEDKAQNNCSLLICGDMNAHTSVNPDFVVDDDPVHVSVLPDEYTPDIELPRFSEHRGHVNNNGLFLLDFCKQTGMRIMNGRVGEDYGIGRYTFVGSRGSSVVDYILSSQDLFTNISHFKVHDPNILSDHCLLSFSFNFENCNAREVTETDYEQVPGKFVWNNDFKPEYIGLLDRAEIAEKLGSLNPRISNCTTRDEANKCLSEFTSLLEDVASPLFKATSNNTNVNASERLFNDKNLNPWYDEHCIEKKHYFLRMLDKYRESKDDVSRIGMVKARSEYKSTLRKCRYEYDKKKTSRFINAKYIKTPKCIGIYSKNPPGCVPQRFHFQVLSNISRL